jgi:hypothetical protein
MKDEIDESSLRMLGNQSFKCLAICQAFAIIFALLYVQSTFQAFIDVLDSYSARCFFLQNRPSKGSAQHSTTNIHTHADADAAGVRQRRCVLLPRSPGLLEQFAIPRKL